MRQRLTRYCLVACMAFIGLSTASPNQLHAKQRQPNILFIMVDDLGPEWISSYGAELIKTPRIDELASGGLSFTNAYSMPQCTPTRVTLLTGQYPFRHGWCNHWDVPRWGAGCHFDWKENASFARILRDEGYLTCAAGKWQINDFRVQPLAMKHHGFDRWCMWTGYESENPPSGERYWDPYIYTDQTPSKTYEGKFGPDLFVDYLIDFMKENRGRPLLMYYPMVLTHGPLVATPDKPNASSKAEKHAAMVLYTDTLVGRLVDAIDELGIRDDTIVIFTTDNGSGGGIRGRMDGREVRGGKAKLTENGPRQPFIVNCPGRVPAGVTSDTLTDFTDILPTFAELAGTKPPAELTLDGYSLAKVILGKRDDTARKWMLAMGFGAASLDVNGVRPRQEFTDRVIRDKQYKVFIINRQITRLHDLSMDPTEEINLLESRLPADRAALARFERTLASFPAKDARPRYQPTPPQPWDRKPSANPKQGKK
jgi:arylsulfatase A-like enzyme